MSTENEKHGKPHYHVVCVAPDEEGPPDPQIFTKKRDAEDTMIAIKRSYMDINAPWESDGQSHYTASGSVRSGHVYISDAFDPGNLYIDISCIMCHKTECLENRKDSEPMQNSPER